MEIFATFDGYTADELIEVKRYIDTKLETMKADKIKTLFNDMIALGISPTDLNGFAKKLADNKPKLPAKYKNPDDPNQTWVGRGKAPNWYAEKVHSGVTKESMLINP